MIVFEGFDVVDMWIVDCVGVGDVVVIGDILLVVKVVDVGVKVLKYNGEVLIV